MDDKPVLNVHAIDLSKPGSYKEKHDLLALFHANKKAGREKDLEKLFETYLAICASIEARCYCPGGEDPASLIALLSDLEFDELKMKVLGNG